MTDCPETTPIIDVPADPPPRRGPPFTPDELSLAQETARVGRIGAGTFWMENRVKYLQRRGLVHVHIVNRAFADVSLTSDAEKALADE